MYNVHYARARWCPLWALGYFWPNIVPVLPSMLLDSAVWTWGGISPRESWSGTLFPERSKDTSCGTSVTYYSSKHPSLCPFLVHEYIYTHTALLFSLFLHPFSSCLPLPLSIYIYLVNLYLFPNSPLYPLSICPLTSIQLSNHPPTHPSVYPCIFYPFIHASMHPPTHPPIQPVCFLLDKLCVVLGRLNPSQPQGASLEGCS